MTAGQASDPTAETMEVLSARYGATRYRWLVVSACLAGTLGMVLSSVSMNVAIPQRYGGIRGWPRSGAMGCHWLSGDHGHRHVAQLLAGGSAGAASDVSADHRGVRSRLCRWRVRVQYRHADPQPRAARRACRRHATILYDGEFPGLPARTSRHCHGYFRHGRGFGPSVRPAARRHRH